MISYRCGDLHLMRRKQQTVSIFIFSNSAEDIAVLCETVSEMDKGIIGKIQ